MKKYILNTLLWSVVLAGAFLIFNRVNTAPPVDDSIAYSDFIVKVKNKLVDRVEMTGSMIKLRTNDGQNLETPISKENSSSATFLHLSETIFPSFISSNSLCVCNK